MRSRVPYSTTYVLAIVRVLGREHVPMPKAKSIERNMAGLMRAFKNIYGHEALMPGRKQPFTPAMWSRIEELAEGTQLRGRAVERLGCRLRPCGTAIFSGLGVCSGAAGIDSARLRSISPVRYSKESSHHREPTRSHEPTRRPLQLICARTGQLQYYNPDHPGPSPPIPAIPPHPQRAGISLKY